MLNMFPHVLTLLLVLPGVYQVVEAKVKSLDKNSFNYGICGLETFNMLKYICCSGTLHKRKKNQECCGNEVIKTNMFWCNYDGEVISYKQTCNNQLYDTRNGICCGGHVHKYSKKTPYLLCCVFRVFNPLTEKCEKEQVVPIDYRWCGDVSYDVRNHVCCNNKLSRRTSSRTYCCGTTLVNHLDLNCCNGVVFNTTHSECCGGNVVEIQPHKKCCGSVIIDTGTHICCERSPVKKVSLSKNECCREKAYDTTTDMCMFGRVKKKLSPLCGTRVYDTTRDRCCNTVLHKDAALLGYRCCSPGYKIYHPKTQICCNSAVRNGSSCSDKLDVGRPTCARNKHLLLLKKSLCMKYVFIIERIRQKMGNWRKQESNEVLYRIKRQVITQKHLQHLNTISIDKGQCKIFAKKRKYILILDPNLSNPAIFRMSKQNKRFINSHRRRCKYT